MNREAMGGQDLIQIGEVADRTGLSLRTIRYYEEVGLVRPATRSQGGFRLYRETDVQRLRVVKRMRSLGFSLEQLRELLDIVDLLEDGPPVPAADQGRLLATLHQFYGAIQRRRDVLREQLATAEAFAALLAGYVDSCGPEAVVEPVRLEVHHLRSSLS